MFLFWHKGIEIILRKKKTTEAPPAGQSKEYRLREEYLHGWERSWTNGKREQDK